MYFLDKKCIFPVNLPHFSNKSLLLMHSGYPIFLPVAFSKEVAVKYDPPIWIFSDKLPEIE